MKDNSTKLLESAYENIQAFNQLLSPEMKQDMLRYLQHAIEVVQKAKTLDDVSMIDRSELSHKGLTLLLWNPKIHRFH